MRLFYSALAVGAAGLAAKRMSTAKRPVVTAADLGSTMLLPVADGAVTGAAVPASSLWSKAGALIFVVRRPGWPLCREEARGLSELVKIRGSRQNFVGIIKEVAPTSQAANDTVLGVGEFERQYFGGGAVYLDEGKQFYGFLGDRKLISTRNVFKALVRPLKTWRSLRAVGDRMKAKGIEGNMVGEGLLLGGVLVVDRDGKVTYSYPETTGEPAPVDAVDEALDALDD